MKFVFLILIVVLVSACQPEENADLTEKMNSICIDGVKYWFLEAAQNRLFSASGRPKHIAICHVRELI